MNEQPSVECDSSVCTATFSASRSKIAVEEPLGDLESENTETWRKLHGRAIVAGERLQEKIDELVTFRFCQGGIELVENLRSENGFGSTCFGARTKAVRRTKVILHFRRRKIKAGRSIALNRASALGFRAIGGGHAAGSIYMELEF